MVNERKRDSHFWYPCTTSFMDCRVACLALHDSIRQEKYFSVHMISSLWDHWYWYSIVPAMVQHGPTLYLCSMIRLRYNGTRRSDAVTQCGTILRIHNLSPTHSSCKRSLYLIMWNQLIEILKRRIAVQICPTRGRLQTRGDCQKRRWQRLHESRPAGGEEPGCGLVWAEILSRILAPLQASTSWPLRKSIRELCLVWPTRPSSRHSRWVLQSGCFLT